jgi:hypothetical protein
MSVPSQQTAVAEPDPPFARPFPMRGTLGVGLLCAVSLALWAAVIVTFVGTLG